MSEEKKPKTTKRSKKSTKAEDPGFIRIDMSTMQPVTGSPIVVFRHIHGR